MAWVDLEQVESFRLPAPLLAKTQRELGIFGARRTEGRVLWAGRLTADRQMTILDVVVPKQSNFFDEVIVEHSEIERVNLDWFERDLVPIGQVHTHPTEAWHSKEDDHFPISTQRGSLSLVIPDFAMTPRYDLTDCALFRLADDWLEVETRLIQITEAA